jgi:DNA recombination protein RmuC
MPAFAIFTISIISALIGAGIAWVFFRLKNQHLVSEARAESARELVAMEERLKSAENQNLGFKRELEKADQIREELENRKIQLEKNISMLETTVQKDRQQTEEKIKLLNEAKERLSAEFKNLANEIFDDKSKKFKEQNKEGLDSLLKPLGEKIKDFEKKISDSYGQEAKERHALKSEIEKLCVRNDQISEAASNLTNALKGESKVQGNWGELILERLLEDSGLKKGAEFEVQESRSSEDGKRLMPDVLINLPQNKHLVIDSKVSLTAYELYCSASDEKEKTTRLAEHILSVRKHIKELSDKNYQNIPGLQSPEFVMMFMPIESACAVALHNDKSLFTEAFDKNIVIVTPMTLLAALKIVFTVWRYERQNQNAMKIADEAGRLYDKFTGFAVDLLELGRKIDSLGKTYEDAKNKLSSGKGNLISRAEKIRELGAKTSKSMPQELVSLSEDVIEVETDKELGILK